MNHDAFQSLPVDGAAELSATGRGRREAMLNALQDRMRNVHRKRRHRTRAVSIACLALLCATAVILTVRTTQTSPRATPDETTTNVIAAMAISVQIFETDPAVVARYAVGNESLTLVTRLNDDQLLAQLSQTGRETGLIRTADKVWLTADVTDSLQ